MMVASMAFYPIFLNVSGKRAVVVGGGPVAVRKAKGLLEAGAHVVVIAPDLTAEPIAATKVDLADEAVTADQLPEDEWLALGRRLVAEKEFRLAMRAFFLAGLAHLAQRQIISLAKHKSNRDYAAEVRRRAQETPVVEQAFTQNVAQVERAWYGLHEVTTETLDRFHANLEQIRAS